VAERQWGVVSRAQLLAMGVSPAAIATWRRRRRLQVVYRGVYSVGHRSLRTEGRRLAAVLACGPGAVLSHMSAASHWGLLHTDQTRIDVTALRGRHGAPGIRLHRSRSLDAQDTTTHEGIPSRRSPARCSIWPQRREAASSSGRWRRRCTCASMTTAPSPTSSPGRTGTEGRAVAQSCDVWGVRCSGVDRQAERVGCESGHSVWKSSPPPWLTVSGLAGRPARPPRRPGDPPAPPPATASSGSPATTTRTGDQASPSAWAWRGSSCPRPR
jgi:hypothetical protein